MCTKEEEKKKLTVYAVEQNMHKSMKCKTCYRT